MYVFMYFYRNTYIYIACEEIPISISYLFISITQ